MLNINAKLMNFDQLIKQELVISVVNLLKHVEAQSLALIGYCVVLNSKSLIFQKYSKGMTTTISLHF